MPKQQRQLNHLLKSWELSQRLVSALQEDFLVFFILKDQYHYAWLNMGIDDVGDSNPVACLVQLLYLGPCDAQLLPCLWTEGHFKREGVLWLFRSQLSTQLPSRAPSGPVWSIAKWGWLFVYGCFWLGLDTGWKQPRLTQGRLFPLWGRRFLLRQNVFFGAWALSVNSSWNPMFWFFAVLVIGLSGYLQEKRSLTAPELMEPGFQWILFCGWFTS